MFFETKAPTSFRYLFFSIVFVYLIVKVFAFLAPFFAPLFLPLYDPESYDIDFFSLVVLPVITLLGSGLIAPLLAHSKPFEKGWEYHLRTQDLQSPFKEYSPHRSEVFRYPILQRDRESFYNFTLGALGFLLLLIASLFNVWLPPTLNLATLGTAAVGLISYGLTGYSQWKRTKGRLSVIWFICIVRQERMSKPEQDHVELHAAITEMLKREEEGAWNRILDAEKYLLQSAGNIIETFLKKIAKLTRSEGVKQTNILYRGLLTVNWRGMFLHVYAKEFQNLFHRAAELKPQFDELLTSQSGTDPTPAKHIRLLKGFTNLLQDALKMCQQRLKIIAKLYD